MGICFYERKKQNNKRTANTGYKQDILNTQNEIAKSICKINIKREGNKDNNGNGFFMNVNEPLHYLITNYHLINEDLKIEYIEIEIYNNKKMKLNLDNRNVKYFPKPKDITLIEIKNDDEIYNDIQFLNYDKNYINGYNIYKDRDIFSIQYSYVRTVPCENGKIISINNYEFYHNLPIDDSSSGCPILLLNNNINLIQVIGIHKETNVTNNTKCGTFIGEIFNDNLNKDDNYIIGEINIKDNEVNQDIRIINSYEEYMKNIDLATKEEEKNEEEIKNCEIRINDKLISFNYFYKFPEKGKYIIKYYFKNNITKTNYMFSACNSLINLNFSNFITQNITNMSHMFFQCSSLINLNLSNFNTQNVTDMSEMFSECKSLTNLNLSNFNTQNVTDIYAMFSGCKSLTTLNLSNFNTQKVTNMEWMFNKCSSLINLDLSNFSTQNVTEMNHMFSGCNELKKEKIISNDERILSNYN